MLNDSSDGWKPRSISKTVRRQPHQGEKTLGNPTRDKDVLCKTYKEVLRFSNRKGTIQLKRELWANEMVWRIKAPARKPKDLSVIPGTCAKLKGEN